MTDIQAQLQEFNTSLAHFTVHRKPKCFVEIEASPSQELLEKAHKKALKGVAKQVSLPGFRKGNAPESLVTNHFAKEIKKEQENTLARLTLDDCLSNSPVSPLKKDEVKVGVQKMKEGDFKVKLLFETHPVIPPIDFSSFTLTPVVQPDLTEEQVDEAVRQSLFFFAKWESLDRPIQEGDFVILDGEIIEKEPAVPLFKGVRFEVVDRSMARWMKDILLGKKTHDVVEGVSVPDESASAADKELFPPRKMRLTVNNVETAIMPTMSPELLKNLGVDSEAALRSNTKLLVQKQLERDRLEKLREQAEKFLLSQCLFDLPQSLVNEELKFRCSHLDKDTQFLKQWETFSSAERKKFLDYLTEQSEKAVRLFQLGNQFLKEQKISLKKDDINAFFTTHPEMLHTNKDGSFSDENRAEVMSTLLLEKVMDYVLGQATNAEAAR